MSKKKQSNNGIILLLVLAVIGVGAGAAYVKYAPADKVPPELRRNNPEDIHTNGTNEDETPIVATKPSVLVPYMEGLELKFRTSSEEIPASEQPIVYVVNKYLEALQPAEVVSPDARLLGMEIIDRTAYLHFNPAFAETHGTFDEKAILDGIRASVGQFTEVDKVQLMIEGQPMETLGHIELDQPIPVLRVDDNGKVIPEEGQEE